MTPTTRARLEAELLRKGVIRHSKPGSPARKAAIDPRYAAEWGAEWAKCAADPVYWINGFCTAYDPRKPEDERYSPFILMPIQEEGIRIFQESDATGKGSLWEKSRDSGVTFLCAYYALHCWLFKSGDATGFGSRKLDMVDTLGDPGSIFEKIRMTLRSLPAWQQPAGFSWTKHSTQGKLVNPSNGSTIIGEGGDNIGRGGRTSRYFIDEAAHLEHKKSVDASLSQNTRVRHYVSTPNGLEEFYRKRCSGLVRVVRFHWSDDTRKNAWEIRDRAGRLIETDAGRHPVYPLPSAYELPQPDDNGLLFTYPWYEGAEARLNPEYRDPAILAQEVDIDYIGSGRPRFDRLYLVRYGERMCPKGIGSGEYAAGWEPEYIQWTGEKWTQAPQGSRKSSWHGDFTCFVEPHPDRLYTIVADTARGLTASGEPDYSVCHVYDLGSGEQVAHYRGRMETHDYGDDIFAIHAMYGYGVVCVEIPGPGETVLTWLIHHLHCGNVYTDVDLDTGAGKEPGVLLTERMKLDLDSDVASIIADMARGQKGFILRHPNTIEEAIHYSRLSSSKCGAEAGGHDDEVACLRLAAKMLFLFGVRDDVKVPRHHQEGEYVSPLRTGRNLRG